MKVIFLDIDGVMNSEIFYRDRHKKRWLKFGTYSWFLKSKTQYILNGFKHRAISLVNYKIPEKHKQFPYLFKRLKEETDPQKWPWLVQLCRETDAKICISSVWKNHFNSKQERINAFHLLGFEPFTFVGITGNRRTLRGDEIKDWIDTHQPIESYAIIDDDCDMLPEQMKNFFQIDSYFGLSPTICYRIKNKLNQ